MSRNEEFATGSGRVVRTAKGEEIRLTPSQHPADQDDVDAYESPHLTEPGQQWRTIRAYHPAPRETLDDGEVGLISLYPTGHTARLEVTNAHQRRGIATAMWDEARRLGWDPKHEGPDRQTPDGQAWARRTP